MARRQTAGVLCLDKPKGVSSRDVVNIVAGLARHNRVGHAGTLDPLATGVLVLCLGWATRLVPLLHLQPKRYRAVFRLGATSDTDDVTGTVIESPGSRVPELREIEDLLPRYTGSILQVPPTFSAIHTDGERAYAKARRGEATELAPRPVEVHALRLAAYDYPVLELDVECGSGTYIRAIGRDLGRDLGTGAVMSDLVRTAVGLFHFERAVSPANLDRSNWREALLPPLAVVEHLPRHVCSAEDLALLTLGRLVPARVDLAERSRHAQSGPGEVDRPSEGPGDSLVSVALVCGRGELVAAGEYDQIRNVIQPRQVFPDAIRDAQRMADAPG